MAIGSGDGRLHVYFGDGTSFSNHQEYSTGEYSILATDMTSDGRWIVVAGEKKNPQPECRVAVLQYQPNSNTYQVFFNFYNSMTGAYAVAISNDHQWLFSGHGLTFEVEVFKFVGDTFKPHSVLKLTGPTVSLDISDDGMLLAIGIFQSETVIFRFTGDGYELFQEIEYGITQAVRPVSITGDGNRLVISHSSMFFVEIYEFNTNSQQFERVEVDGSLAFPNVIMHAEFNSKQDRVAIATTGANYVFSYSNGTIEAIFKQESEGDYITFSRDDKYMVTGEVGIARVFQPKDSNPCNLSFCLSCNDSRCLVCNELLDYHLNETSGECELCEIDNCVQCLNLTHC